MGIMPDHWIRKMAREQRMIEPFADRTTRLSVALLMCAIVLPFARINTPAACVAQPKFIAFVDRPWRESSIRGTRRRCALWWPNA